jgi:hypothetical protein
MALCSACQAVPLRSMFSLMDGDEAARDAFQWISPLGSVSEEDHMKGLYVRWHPTLSDLRDSARSCSFCSLLYSRMEEHWRFKMNSVTGDTRTLWLEVPRSIENPLLSVWIGNARPEAIISGIYGFHTTLGKAHRLYLNDKLFTASRQSSRSVFRSTYSS